MPILTTTAVIMWTYIVASSYILSTDIYYPLENKWIPIIPFIIFLFSWFTFFKKTKKNTSPTKKADKTSAYQQKKLQQINKLFEIVSIILLSVVIVLLIYINKIIGISILDAQELRNGFYSSLQELGGSVFIWIIWIFLSMLNALFLFGTAIDINRKKPFSFVTTVTLITIVVWSLISGGRIAIFAALVIYTGAWTLSTKRIKISKRVTKGLIVTLLLILPPLIFQQINRTQNSNSTIGESVLIKYFVGPIFALDQLINTKITDEISETLGKPRTSFIGADTILVSGFMRGVLGTDIESALAATSSYFHNGVYIANDITMNAHYTAGSRFYIDFGIAGFTLTYLILGILCIYVDKSRKKFNSIYFPIIAGLSFLSIIYSSRELLIDSPAFLLTIMWILLTKRHIEKSEKPQQYKNNKYNNQSTKHSEIVY